MYVHFLTDLAVNDGHYMCEETLATSLSLDYLVAAVTVMGRPLFVST